MCVCGEYANNGGTVEQFAESLVTLGRQLFHPSWNIADCSTEQFNNLIRGLPLEHYAETNKLRWPVSTFFQNRGKTRANEIRHTAKEKYPSSAAPAETAAPHQRTTFPAYLKGSTDG